MRDIPVKVNGNSVSADEYNSQTQEEKNLVTDTGQTLDPVDNFQVSKSVANYSSSGDFYNEVGAVNAYVLSPQGSKKGVTAYQEGLRVRFNASNTNTGIATVNINGLGVKTIKTYGNQDLAGGEIQSGVITELEYDGVNFRLSEHHQSVIINSSFNGFIISNNSLDSDHDVDISAASCSDSTNSVIIVNRLAGFNKRIDAPWAIGSGNGGLANSVTLQADTWYHYFVIMKVDGTFDAGFDTSVNATNLLSSATGYIFFRRIGSVLTDSSENILGFYMVDLAGIKKVMWKTPKNNSISVPPAGTTIENLIAIQTPLGISVNAIMNNNWGLGTVVTTGTAGRARGALSSPFVDGYGSGPGNFVPDSARTATLTVHDSNISKYAEDGSVVEIITDTSSQIRYTVALDAALDNTDLSYEMTVFGWYE